MCNSTGGLSLRVKLLETREEHFPRTELEYQRAPYMFHIKSPLFSLNYGIYCRFSITMAASILMLKTLCDCTCVWITLVSSIMSVILQGMYFHSQYWNSVKKQNRNTQFLRSESAGKVSHWQGKISVFHWCLRAIHSHDNAHVLDSDSSYTWMIIRWWVWAPVCHETSMTEWWDEKRAWSLPVIPPRPLPTIPHSTDLSFWGINDNNGAYSEMDAPFVNPVILKTLSMILPFLSHICLSFSPW